MARSFVGAAAAFHGMSVEVHVTAIGLRGALLVTDRSERNVRASGYGSVASGLMLLSPLDDVSFPDI